jgi:ABC-2 type transport system ATP-binding protein
MSASVNVVEVRDLSKRFGKFTAVDRVNFHIPHGEIYGLLGPNGAGKTTIIRMLCGLMLPDEGSATVLGFDIARQPEEIKKRIGYMSQKFSLYNDLTALENISFYTAIYGVPSAERGKRVDELVEMAGLKGHERELTRNLSGAWRQRLALACSIVHRPLMLFLDEATAGVDPISRREFWDLIYTLAAEGVSVLATTHYMDEADYCNTIGMMYQGELIALASPDTLKDDMPGTLLQVDCDRLGDAVPILQALHGVTSVAAHGVQLHVVLSDPDKVGDVKKTLSEAGINIRSAEIIQPSLEDAFISMVAGRQAAGTPIIRTTN